MLTATLDKLTEYAHRYPEVQKDEVRKGDWIIIRTVRSVYTLHSLGDGLYEVRGGWYDQKGMRAGEDRRCRGNLGRKRHYATGSRSMRHVRRIPEQAYHESGNQNRNTFTLYGKLSCYLMERNI